MKRTLILCLLLSLCSCAFGNRHVTLNYMDNGKTVTPQPQNGKVIVMFPFVDQRANRSMIGEVRNGYGMHTADVIADNSVAEWITNAVKMELEKAGYKVIISDRNNSPANFEMGGSILEVHCTAMMTYEGRVSFLVQLQKRGRILLQKSYTGNGNAGVNWAASSSSYDSSIEAALSDAIKNLIPDVNTAINNARDVDTADGPADGPEAELIKLKKLFDSGAITQDEYNTAKQKVLQKF